MLTMYKMHHPKADIDRLYIKRKEGGRGLMQIEAAYKAEIINIAEYLNTNYKKYQLVNIVKNHENTQPAMNSVTRLAAKIMEELDSLQGQRGNTRGQAKHEGKIGRGFEEEMGN